MTRNMDRRSTSGSRRRMTREEAMAIQRNEMRRLRKKRKRRRVLIGIECLVLLILLAGGFILFKLGKLDRVALTNLKTYHDSGPYTNIALFGLDSRSQELNGGVNSDTIIIASINNKTKDVKLVSVYRDTLLEMPDGYYHKINSAYLEGPENALNALNYNLDMDIKNYVAINFEALIRTIDMLGGIDVEMTAEEAFWCDGYIAETALAAGMPIQGEEDLLPHQNGGTYHLNGIQATAFCRIRYTDGYDFRRTERQRYVLKQVLDKAKDASVTTLNDIADEVLPLVSTSFKNSDIISLGLNVANYNLVDTTGFPFESVSDWTDSSGSQCVVAVGYEDNVKKLHEWLFPDQEYEVSEEVHLISETIIYITGISPVNN
ncbi:MAG: LCP family protein [Clostridiales bacterium]|nr:LCP family protein [Clostridiales bacterium]